MTRGVAYGLATPLVASTATATAKFLASDLSPWFIVWIQYGICCLVMIPWLVRHRGRALKTRHPILHLIRSLFGWLGFTTYYLALPHIPLVDAALLRAAAPIWVPMIVFIWLRTTVPGIRWLALLGGFTGVLLILQPQGGQISAGHLLGLAAGMSLAGSMATTRRLSASEPASRVLFYYFFISFIASTPMGVAHAVPLSAAQIPGLIYVGLSIFLTMVLYTRAYTYAATTVVAPLSYVAVPLSGLMDWYFWHELPNALALAGTVAVIASGILAVTAGARQGGEH
jgi:drug/metabolite transporter (DMT)-like permease